MKTLLDELEILLAQREIAPLVGLLHTYNQEKDAAKCYSTLAYLSCCGAGGSKPLAEKMSQVIEAFFLGTSIHDDALDQEDQHVRARSRFSRNTYLVLGDCFLIRLGVSMAAAAGQMPQASRDVTLSKFETYMHDVAESQIADEHSHGQIPEPDAAIRQMKLRGGTWGRVCTEIPALAAGLPPEEASQLGDAGEKLFMALTLRDDLRDLADDLNNGVLTLAPALYFQQSEEQTGNSLVAMNPPEASQTAAIIDTLHEEGIVERTLQMGRQFVTGAMTDLDTFLNQRDGMDWYLLLMIFRLVQKRFTEFTADHVRQDQLGIGFSADRPDGLATIGF